jgi:hypothetical protein
MIVATALEISLDELILAKDMQEEPADQGEAPKKPRKGRGK